MKYVSTRGTARGDDFASVLLSGLAPDGGLFIPERLEPFTPDELAAYRDLDYAGVAKRILTHFAGDSLPTALIDGAVDSALSRFHHAAIAPHLQLDENTWLLELYHGPTFAFKDYALQIVGELIDRQLAAEGRRATIICATSGDTGAAAAAAFAGRENVDVVVLHPLGRVSDVQRRQMTTLPDANVRNFAVRGDFDTCQAMVKTLFLDPKSAPLNFTAVNSINWARIICQTVYYVWSSLKLNSAGPVNYVIPTGNFGNILAADIARILCFPVGQLMLSSNENDVLPRFFDSGAMECRDTVETLSPSMDIQLSSNFERALWMALDQDAAAVSALQAKLAESGQYHLMDAGLTKLRKRFSALACQRDQALSEMRRVQAVSGQVLCPHTATASFAAQQTGFEGTTVVVGTAHPAKFTQAVEQALGQPAAMPALLAPVLNAPERFETIDADTDALRDHLLDL
ncbi:MAG TPA: threonine synthase [Gammaproteobacteria bacterium]|jgi:threonine synthase|nr:threonine synthase [Gammaproteobacteria bacterium]